MSNPGTSPQFDTAEFKSAPIGNSCGFCGLQVGQNYYKVNGKLACSQCAQRATADLPRQDRTAFIRAIAIGCLAALVGLVIYSTVVIATGYTIGYLSLGVGYIVAKGMMMGSKGIGGRKYQVVAVLLTYAAVSMSAIPIWFHYRGETKSAKTSQTRSAAPPANPSAEAPTADASNSSTNPDSAPKAAKPKIGFMAMLAMLVGLGLASPFLELASPAHGLIGLIILFVGIRIAWRVTAGTRRVSVEGPYNS